MDPGFRIVQRLADGRFHSGETLAREGGISRAAVWKRIERLRDDLGLVIHAVRGRGYRLAEPLELLDDAQILAAIPEDRRRLLRGLEIHPRIDSTNRHLLDHAQRGGPAGTACLAEQQTAGRGRRGRRWVSPFGSNLYLSLLWQFPCGPAQLSGLSLALGLAVARALEGAGVHGVGLKWPNDLIWGGRKLAGLLLEMAGEHTGPSRVVIGVGVNTRLPATDAAAIGQPWIDLAGIPGLPHLSRNRLAGLLIGGLLEEAARFEQQGFSALMQEWLRYDIHYRQPVRIQQGDHWIDGTHCGVDANGALRLDNNGTLLTFHGGEVSLRAAERKMQ